MLKKFTALALTLIMIAGLVGCNATKKNSDSTSGSTNSSIKIKTTDDFSESAGLVKYFTIEGKKFALPETVGEYVNYLKQLGTVTLGDTGKSVDDVELKAKGISSMVAYLNVETSDGQNQHFLVRYKNPTNSTIKVSEATVIQIQLTYKPLSDQDYEKVFSSIQIVTSAYTFKMDGKSKIDLFYKYLGTPSQATDGRLKYSDEQGYSYIFDCSNENAYGIFRDCIITYPTSN